MADEIHVVEKAHLNRSSSTDVDVPLLTTSDLHYYVRRASEQQRNDERRQQAATTELSETSKSSRRRRPSRSNLRIYISAANIMLVMCFIAIIGTVLGVDLPPSSNKNINININDINISNNESPVIVDEQHVSIGTPPANVENHDSPAATTPPASVTDAIIVPMAAVTLPAENPNGDGDDGTISMVVMEVEIDGNTVDPSVAETRAAAAGFGETEDLASIHVYRKLKNNNNDVKVDDNDNDDDEELLYSSSCIPGVYYKPIQKGFSRNEFQKLLEASHRKTLPYTDKNSDDVWKALKDLDRGNETGSVRLIYSNKDIPAEPKGTPASWNREHVWPKSLGVGYSGPDFTDVHHLFPADWGVNSIRSNRYFDRCTDESVCRIPSELKDSNDPPFFGGDVFQPPLGVRGDIARAIFYMDLRYPHLELTDCPDTDTGDEDSSNSDNKNKKNQMAYLSTLLAWHKLDPPTEVERVRNNRVCSRWQGNRNPFVDYPDLAKIMYGTAARDTSERLSRCSSSSSNDNDDEREPPVVELLKLPVPGDVMIAAVHSDNPDLVALVTLEDLPVGLVIHITDNAYDGSSFASNEGTLSLTLPEAIKAGTVFGYGEGLLYGSSWSSEMDKGFSLSASGDNVIVYYTRNAEETNFTFLSAFSFAGAFKGAGEEYTYYGTSSSALPESIKGFSVALKHLDNYVYAGQTTGIKASLQEHLVDKKNWKGSNSKTNSVLSLAAQPDGFVVIE